MRTLYENKKWNAFVADNTLYKRDRSKKVELLSKVFDHDEMKYRKGFRLLTVGWTDGFSFIPVAFRLISSARSMLRMQGKNMIEELLPESGERNHHCPCRFKRWTFFLN